jgi:O-antigen ligase
VATLVAAIAIVVVAAQTQHAGAPEAFEDLAGVVTLAAAAYLIWTVDPVYTFCAALLLSPISGSWDRLGVPGYASPDRVLLIATLGAVLLRAAGAADRPRLRLEPIHWLMLVTAIYAAGSALLAGTLFERGPAFELLEAFGLLPFALFLLAPVVFRTERQREVLLATFVALGTYLGLTALFETLEWRALVWPDYILDPHYGVNPGHARGPFAEPVTMGFALFMCAVASAIAWSRWRIRGRGYLALFAGGVALLCLAGAFMTLQRSVWLGAGAGTLVAVFAVRETRRYAPGVIAAVALMVGASMLLIPGFADRVSNRSSNQQTIWERKNLNRAAMNMIEERPLFGFGWNRFLDDNAEYFEQADDYPLTDLTDLNIHNSLLTYGVELGLVGLLLWIAVLVTGIGGALSSRGPPDLRAWRIGLLAIAVCFVAIMNFVPPARFPALGLWLWAGVVWSGRYAAREALAAGPATGRREK